MGIFQQIAGTEMSKKFLALIGVNLIALYFLTGCGSNSGAAVLQAIELTECEIGEVSLNGEIKTGANPLAQGSVFFNMREVHTVDDIPAHCKGLDNE